MNLKHIIFILSLTGRSNVNYLRQPIHFLEVVLSLENLAVYKLTCEDSINICCCIATANVYSLTNT